MSSSLWIISNTLRLNSNCSLSNASIFSVRAQPALSFLDAEVAQRINESDLANSESNRRSNLTTDQ